MKQERAQGVPVPRGSGAFQLAKGTVQSFLDDDCSTLGASLAYFTVFSLAPLLLVVIRIAGLALGRQTVQHSIEGQIAGLIGSDAATEVRTMLEHATQNRAGGVAGTVIGLVLLLVGATGTFGSLQDAQPGLEGKARSKTGRNQEFSRPVPLR